MLPVHGEDELARRHPSSYNPPLAREVGQPQG